MHNGARKGKRRKRDNEEEDDNGNDDVLSSPEGSGSGGGGGRGVAGRVRKGRKELIKGKGLELNDTFPTRFNPKLPSQGLL